MKNRDQIIGNFQIACAGRPKPIKDMPSYASEPKLINFIIISLFQEILRHRQG